MRTAALFFLLFLPASLARAQPAPLLGPEPPRGPAEQADTVRVLLVLVRFADDPLRDAESFVPGWPAAARPALPAFAAALLAPSPEDLPGPDSSLSRYFYDQSRRAPGLPGRQVVTGDVMPRDASDRPFVYVTRHPNAWYHAPGGRGYGYLTQEVLAALVARPGFDLARYDGNHDDELDELWLVIRSEAAHRVRGGPVGYSGCANLYGCAAPLTGYPGVQVDATQTPPPFLMPSPSRGTIRVDWTRSGVHVFAQTPANLSAQHYFVSLLAHEWGHHLWSDTHLQPVGGRGIPAADSPARAGYALMIGDPDPRAEGSLTLSVVERALRGWVAVEDLTGPSRTVTLPDLYSGAKAAALPLPAGRLYVSNHQRVGFFDRLRSHPGNRALTGLLAPGLLVTYTAGGFTASVLAPDNTLEQGAVYVGGANPHPSDVFGPDTQTQLTPWTRPNSEGSYAPLGFVRTWAALDSIRYTGGADGEMAFEYVADVRARPIVRADSWITPASSGQTLTGPLVVRDGAALDVDLGPGGRLTLAAGLAVHAGARVDLGGEGQTITVGGAVRLAPGAAVRVRAGTTLRLRTPALRAAFEGPDVAREPGVHLTLVADAAFEATLLPDPGRHTATLRLRLPGAAPVRAEVFDVLGRRVARVAAGLLEAGDQTIALDTHAWPAGVYVWRAAAGGQQRTGTFTYVR